MCKTQHASTIPSSSSSARGCASASAIAAARTSVGMSTPLTAKSISMLSGAGGSRKCSRKRSLRAAFVGNPTTKIRVVTFVPGGLPPDPQLRMLLMAVSRETLRHTDQLLRCLIGCAYDQRGQRCVALSLSATENGYPWRSLEVLGLLSATQQSRRICGHSFWRCCCVEWHSRSPIAHKWHHPPVLILFILLLFFCLAVCG